MRSDALFLDSFRKIVEHYPDNVAIEYCGVPFATYSQLDLEARTLAANLIADGAKPETFVGIAVEKSPEYIVAMLAVWYAGAAFVPLDPKLPEARLQQMETECQPVSYIRSDDFAIGGEPLTLPVVITPQTLAYAIFTSGSTGRPKGVLVTHAGITNLLAAQIAAFNMTSESRSLFMLSTNFDASVSDIGCALLSGATLVMEPPEQLQPGPRFVELIAQRRISHIDIPPSLLRMLPCSEMPSCLETLIIGGEVCPPAVVREWASRFLVVNVYGPTEATVCSSLVSCDPITWHRPLIGSSLPNVEYRIIDEELYIGGIGVARGYLNRTELNERKFVELEDARWYRTGDRVVQHSNGEIEFLGRIDRQVKVRGVLVEPEEIEARIAEHPAVKRVVVIKRSVGGNDREGLVAFCILDPAVDEPTIKSLRDFVSEKLPRWMIPHRWQFVSAFPHTASGKVDLDALTSFELKHQRVSAVETTDVSSAAAALLDVVQNILSVDGITLDDDFFELGGDSFAVIELSLAAESRGIALSPSLVMSRPKLKDLLAASSDNDAMKAAELRSDVTQFAANFTARKSTANSFSTAPQNVLVTGATGFLGSRVLNELLKTTESHITCLVRCADATAGLERISISPKYISRVTVVPSDLEQRHFGLTDDAWTRLAEEIDSIFHCAASVNMLLPYSSLRRANVEATVEIARFMSAGRRKWLHYASTLSVFVATDQNTGTVFETDDLSHTERVYGGYAQSKWAAEVFLRSVEKSVGPISYHRFGLIVAASDGGKSPKNDFLDLFAEGISSLSCVPESESNIAVDVTPVDFAAAAMVDLSLRDMSESNPHTYHIANAEPLILRDLIEILRGRGNKIDTISVEQFENVMQTRRLTAAESAASLALCRTFSAPSFDRLRTMDLFQATDITFDMTNTLARTKLRCPAVSGLPMLAARAR